MKKKVAIAGTVLTDVVKMIDRWPEKGMLVTIGDVSKAVGGCVCNTGIDLKRLDGDVIVEAYGKVGNDEYGEFLRDFMSREGLDLKGLKVANDLPTSFTDVMTCPNGERTFFTKRGANSAFGPADVDVNALDCDLFHLGYLLLMDGLDAEDEEFGTAVARILHDVQARGIKTSIDLVSERAERFTKIIPPALKYCDYVVINEVEGGMLTGVPPRDEDGKTVLANFRIICERLLDMGVRDTVVLHCPELSCCMGKDKKFQSLASLSLPEGYIKGAVGAGDAFCAGMLYSFVQGIEPVEGMKIASCAAACNLAAADSVGGAKSLEETLKLDKLFGRKQIEC